MSGNSHNSKLHDFTCQDTGISLKLKKIPFTVTARLHELYDKEHEADVPKPPLFKVDYGDGATIMEPNITHPTYIARLRRYETERGKWVNERALHLFADMAIECDVDVDAVNSLRKEMDLFGVELDQSDKYVYVWNIAVGTDEGYSELFLAIQRRSQVTESAVGDALARFQAKG